MPDRTQHRLRKHTDYQRVYKTARKAWAQQIAYFSTLREANSEAALRSETLGPRVGLTVPRALGKAVDRNRIKRRLRELVRKHLPVLEGLPLDVVLHPKRSVLTATAAELDREIGRVFRTVRSKHGRAGSEASTLRYTQPKERDERRTSGTTQQT